MPLAAAIVGGSAIVGGVLANKGAKSAAKAAQQAQDTATAESARQFDLTRADTAPYREAGAGALSRLTDMFVNGTTPITFDPGHQFALEQGQRAIDASAAARGRLLSGAAVKEGMRYATGLADQQTNSTFNRLAALAGLGQAGVNTSASAGMTSAGQIGTAAMNAGAQRGSAYMQGAAGINNAIQGGAQNLLLMRYLNGPSIAGGSTMAMNYGGPLAGGGLA